MKIGELARATCVSTDTLRFYEKRGLIHSERRSNGYRDFDEATVQRVALIRLGKGLGFNLREMTELSQAMTQDTVDAEHTRDVLTQKLAETDERIKHLHELREMLAVAIETACPLTR